jgi:hypothetical protein
MIKFLDQLHWAWKIVGVIAVLISAVWAGAPVKGNGIDPHLEQTRILNEMNGNLREIKGYLSRGR